MLLKAIRSCSERIHFAAAIIELICYHVLWIPREPVPNVENVCNNINLGVRQILRTAGAFCTFHLHPCTHEHARC